MTIVPFRKRMLAPVVGCAIALLTAGGCGPGDAPPGFGEDEHHDVLLAATAVGGGALAADYDFENEPVEVTLSASLEGVRIYTAADPGLMMLEEDEPDEGVFVLADDTAVSMEITAASAGVSFLFANQRLSAVGDSVVLGTTPELHGHGVWQVAVPDDDTGTEERVLGFKLTTTNPAYGPSPEYHVHFELVEAEGE